MEKLYHFLMGLNFETFGIVRIQILNSDSLPNSAKAYSMVKNANRRLLEEEKHTSKQQHFLSVMYHTLPHTKLDQNASIVVKQSISKLSAGRCMAT